MSPRTIVFLAASGFVGLYANWQVSRPEVC